MTRRVVVIGLDCAPPSLVFGRFRDAMPNVSRMMDRGTWGPLRSTVPPITVPAWACMTSGRDPGELGLYGFRNRLPGSYAMRVTTSRHVTAKRVWDFLGDAGKRVAVLFVPPGWPPPAVRGVSTSCFLTASDERSWAFPHALERELERRFGAYIPDVRDFRTDDRARVLSELRAMAAQHFAIARHVLETERPDFLMMVEIGPDRLHHALWDQIDPTHPRFDASAPWHGAARAYYAELDAHVGALAAAAGEDATVLVVSDHGARTMRGGVHVNEWLRRGGWLTLAREPSSPMSLDEAGVDWSRTRAWGDGGYYARIFLNVRGREPDGTIAPEAYEDERTKLARALERMTGPDGLPLGNLVVRPEHAYRRTRGTPPDLMVFFGDLAYRSLGTVGSGAIFSESNDTGPDACNHDWNGIFVMSGGGAPARGRVGDLVLYDVARTVLGLSGVAAPADLLGRDLSSSSVL